MLAAWRQEGEDTEVELFSPKARGQFAALGISQDSKMGEDLVMSCAEVRGEQVVTGRYGGIGRNGERRGLDWAGTRAGPTTGWTWMPGWSFWR